MQPGSYTNLKRGNFVKMWLYEGFDPANIFKPRDALLAVRKHVLNFGFDFMFEDGPDFPVVPYIVYRMEICSALLITPKQELLPY